MNRRVFTFIYIALVVASSVYFAISTVNYLQFYPALQTVSAHPETQQILNDSQSSPAHVLLELKIANPTGYSGLRIEYVVVHLFFTATDNNSIFENFPLLGSNSTRVPLGPGTSVNLRIILPLAGNQSNLLSGFMNKYGASVVSSYNVEIHLFTFLDALAPDLEVVRDVEYTGG